MNVYKGKGDNSSQQKSKARSRILIAEDDGDTALTYKTALEKAGYGVIAVDNGEDCAKAYIEEFQKLKVSKGEAPTNTSTHWNQPFEAVILDYNMPQNERDKSCQGNPRSQSPSKNHFCFGLYRKDRERICERPQTGCRIIAKALS